MPNTKPVYQRLAALLMQRENCANANPRNDEWFQRSTESIKKIVREHMPRGSGFDIGTTLDLDKSNGERLVFGTAFHHMDDNGSYDGWSEHTVTVRGSLFDRFSITIGGRDRNRIKEHIHEVFYSALGEEVED